MKLKKTFSFLLMGAMTVSLWSASAVLADSRYINTNKTKSEVTTSEKTYAYFNYDKADDATKKLILKAREEIVFGNSGWSVDGQGSIKHADGTITKLPKFKDLYPDWDLSQLTPKENPVVNNIQSFSPLASSNGDYDFEVPVYIPYSNGGYSAYFLTFNALTTTEVTWALTLPNGITWNVGYRNVNTNTYLSWYPNLEKKDEAVQQCKIGVRYGVRCSTNDITTGGKRGGNGYIYVQAR